MQVRWRCRGPRGTARELHISKAARERYGFDDLLFSLTGNVLFANLRAVRTLVEAINQGRDVLRHPDQGISAGDLNAAGLIDELWHHLLDQYRESRHGGVLADALAWLSERFGDARIERAMERFLEFFPSMPVLRGEVSAAEYLQQSTAGVPNRQVVLEELLMLWLANQNPAFTPLRELFDDGELEQETGYREVVASLEDFFRDQPPATEFVDGDAGSRDPAPLSLFEQLLTPIRQAPASLGDQLRLLLDSGWLQLPTRQFDRLLVAMDVMKEEARPSFRSAGAAPGPPSAPPPVHDFAGQGVEEERFSEDRDWMPEVVLVAKNTYVWLHQLSLEYDTDVQRLDQIPDAELDRLAGRGFNALWLIGIWERSRASQRVKQLCGNPEAVSSAYSLRSYRVAEMLGGDDGWDDLRRRAEARGIRLACDMVPNHTGIDSEWIVEHPERFLSLPHSPYPNYRFSGEDLCEDPRVEVRLEDHYFDRTDAAVVFQRRDTRTGEVRYVYHGNDGTSIPWNDTAQLDYLDAETREAVIQTILDVARRFSVIRFDAAMTLAKRHIQRLWYPKPGQGGAIPSRAEHALSDESFQRRIPEEFWREVVDRVAAEVPDTLLLAEAFWLMEGYFVRTLGMHRVYNSAFMHMLRDEENAKFRQTLRNTLEFDPDVLKRFVNYLTTPDEEPAAVQVGTGEKYFCVCTLMATLPGLPMFGHGQFEGLREKYGMEYARSYRDESADAGLVTRHDHEIVPLLRLRRIFAEVAHFRLYDFQRADGSVNEDVYVLSNRCTSQQYGDERALVFVHNAAAFTEGRAHRSVAWRQKLDPGEGHLVHSTLGETLEVHPGGPEAADGQSRSRRFLLARDLIRGREYLRPSDEVAMQGFALRLGPYERRVLVDLREVHDTDGRYERLWQSVGPRGVPSLDDALAELRAAPVQEPLRDLLGGEVLRQLWLGKEGAVPADLEAPLTEAFSRVRSLLLSAAGEPATEPEAEAVGASVLVDMVEEILRDLERLQTLPVPSQTVPASGEARDVETPATVDSSAELGELGGSDSVEELQAPVEAPLDTSANEVDSAIESLLRVAPAPAGRFALLAWIVLRPLGRLLDTTHAQDDSQAPPTEATRELFDTWLLDRVVRDVLLDLGLEAETAQHQAAAVALFAARPQWWVDFDLGEWLQEPAMRRFLGVNRFDEVDWFGKEEFAELRWWLAATAAVQVMADGDDLARAATWIEHLRSAEMRSEYRVVTLVDQLASVADRSPET